MPYKKGKQHNDHSAEVELDPSVLDPLQGITQATNPTQQGYPQAAQCVASHNLSLDMAREQITHGITRNAHLVPSTLPQSPPQRMGKPKSWILHAR